MIVEQHHPAADPQTKPTDLGHQSTWRLLESIPTTKSWGSFYCPVEVSRLSWPGGWGYTRLQTYQPGLIRCNYNDRDQHVTFTFTYLQSNPTTMWTVWQCVTTNLWERIWQQTANSIGSTLRSWFFTVGLCKEKSTKSNITITKYLSLMETTTTRFNTNIDSWQQLCAMSTFCRNTGSGSPNTPSSLDKMWNFNSLQKWRKMTLLKQLIKLERLCTV